MSTEAVEEKISDQLAGEVEDAISRAMNALHKGGVERREAEMMVRENIQEGCTDIAIYAKRLWGE